MSEAKNVYNLVQIKATKKTVIIVLWTLGDFLTCKIKNKLRSCNKKFEDKFFQLTYVSYV